MPQDTFTIRLLAKELSSSLRGGRINRINQPGKEELSLLIYTQKGTLKLTINANAADCGVYFTTDNPPNPLTFHDGQPAQPLDRAQFLHAASEVFAGRGDPERGNAGV